MSAEQKRQLEEKAMEIDARKRRLAGGQPAARRAAVDAWHRRLKALMTNMDAH